MLSLFAFLLEVLFKAGNKTKTYTASNTANKTATHTATNTATGEHDSKDTT